VSSFFAGFGMTPVERQLLLHGGAGRRVPRGAERITVVVRDPEGIDCEGAKYPLLALRGMSVDLWVTHHEVGSFHLVEGGETTKVGGILSARFRRGAELVLTATGEDASRALDIAKEMLEAAPEERRAIYRRRLRSEASSASRRGAA
jgi:phosphotransferase system HPr-like phosphotransfer protein